MTAQDEQPIIWCELSHDTRRLIEEYAEDLRRAAFTIGNHGLTETDFWASGLFQSAIERLRGTQSATTDVKRDFIARMLTYMKQHDYISDWQFSGAGERHDYEVYIGERTCIIEAKGCLDGNNTAIFERPANADEFIIWSLCQNPGSDPRHNAWSGIHTRLSADVIHRRQIVNAVIIWDMLCGTPGRMCPKVLRDPQRATEIDGRTIPPPCIYLFPPTVPDPRNNPSPRSGKLQDVVFAERLYQAFHCTETDVVQVKIEAKMQASDILRRTLYTRAGVQIKESKWTKLKRAK